MDIQPDSFCIGCEKPIHSYKPRKWCSRHCRYKAKKPKILENKMKEFVTKYSSLEIKEIEIVRMTKSSVWIFKNEKEHRIKRYGDYEQFHETQEKAFRHLEYRLVEKLNSIILDTEKTQNQIQKLRETKEQCLKP